MAAPNFETISPVTYPVLDDAVRMVEQRTKHQPERQDGFSIARDRFTLDDGSRYDACIFHPDKPKFDTAVTYTTPWCTDLNGFNRIFGERLANQGMVAIEISPERLRPTELLRRFGSLALSHDVQAQHAVLNYIDKADWRSKPGVSINTGYSRGAMIGFGINAYSAENHRDVVYSDYIDPCLEHPVAPRDIDWAEIPAYLGHEVIALAKGLGKTDPRTLYRIAKGALPVSACFWLQQAATGKALFGGEAGDFVAMLHPDTVGHVTLYDSSRFNHSEAYSAALRPFKNITIQQEPGYHMSGVDPAVQYDALGRVVLVQHLLQDKATVQEISSAVRSTRLQLVR